MTGQITRREFFAAADGEVRCHHCDSVIAESWDDEERRLVELAQHLRVQLVPRRSLVVYATEFGRSIKDIGKVDLLGPEADSQ